MNLGDIIGMATKNPQLVQSLAGQFGLSETQTAQAVNGLMGAMAGGVQNNVQKGGLESLLGALQGGNHQQYLEQPEKLPEAKEEGNKILGHILGGKEESRAVAKSVSAQTGVSDDILKQMLPMIAMAAMGSLGKSQSQQGNPGMASILMGALDQDGDGSPLNDIMGMLGGAKR